MSRIQDLEKQLLIMQQEIGRKKSELSEQKRKDDTKQKILLGGMVLMHMRADPTFRDLMLPLILADIGRLKQQRDKDLLKEAIDTAGHGASAQSK